MERKGTGPSISARAIAATGAASILCAAGILYLLAGEPAGNEAGESETRLLRDSARGTAPEGDSTTEGAHSSGDFVAADSQIDASSSQIDAFGSQIDVSESQIDASGSQIDVSGSQIDASESQIDASGSQIDVSESQIDASGPCANSGAATGFHAGGSSAVENAGPAPPDTSRYARAGLVDARRRAPCLLVDLKYAGPDNLLGQPLYSDLETCYLQPEAVRMLAAADSILRARRPDLRLLLFDCARPLQAQRQLWELVRGTPLQRYVADPSRGSMHNYGTAVDLTLATEAGQELDMGTPYDFLGPESQPREEERLSREGRLTEHQLTNRRLLRSVMTEAGFHPIAIEWWHFEAFDKERTRREFTIIP